RRLGVQVELATPVDGTLIEHLAPDAIVLATGSVPLTVDRLLEGHRMPNTSVDTDLFGLRELANIYNPHQVMTGAAPLNRADGKPAPYVVFDRLGFYQSSDPLEYLLAQGCRVT